MIYDPISDNVHQNKYINSLKVNYRYLIRVKIYFYVTTSKYFYDINYLLIDILYQNIFIINVYYK